MTPRRAFARVIHVHRALRPGFLRDTGVLTAASVAVAAITAVQGVLLARWLGPAGYGIVALANATPAAILAFLSPESVHATVRYLADREAAQDHRGALAVLRLATLVDAAVGAGALLVVVVASPVVGARVLHGEASAWLVVVAAAGMATAAPAEAAAGCLMHARRFGWVGGLQVAQAALRAGLALGVVGAGAGPVGAVVAGAVGTAVGGLATLAVGTLEARRRWQGSWVRVPTRALGPLRREVLGFLGWTDLAGLLGTVTKQLDVVVVGAAAGTAEAGAYRLARSLAGVVGYVVGPLQAAAYPRLAALWAERGALRAAVRRHAALGGALALAALPGLLLVAPVVRHLVGASYDRAVPMAVLLLLANIIWMGLYWLRPLYMAAGEVRVWVGISATMVVGSVVVFWPVARAWGGVGMAGVQVVAAVAGHAIAGGRVGRLMATRLPATREAMA